MRSTFTPRDVVALIKRKQLPAVVMVGWLKGKNEIVADVAARCVQREIARKI